MRKTIAGIAIAIVVGISTVGGTSGCKNAQQAESGIFTTEQIVCMVIGMTSGALTGTAQVIAADLQQACNLAPTLTQDIINFVNDFQNLSPAQQEKWKAWAAKAKTGSDAGAKP